MTTTTTTGPTTINIDTYPGPGIRARRGDRAVHGPLDPDKILTRIPRAIIMMHPAGGGMACARRAACHSAAAAVFEKEVPCQLQVKPTSWCKVFLQRTFAERPLRFLG